MARSKRGLLTLFSFLNHPYYNLEMFWAIFLPSANGCVSCTRTLLYQHYVCQWSKSEFESSLPHAQTKRSLPTNTSGAMYIHTSHTVESCTYTHTHTHTEGHTEYRAIYLVQIINLFKVNVRKLENFGLWPKSGRLT